MKGVRRGREVGEMVAGADGVGGKEEGGGGGGVPGTSGEGEDLLASVVRIDSERGCQQQLIEESEGEEKHSRPSTGKSPEEASATEFLPEEVSRGLGHGGRDEVEGGGSIDDHHLIGNLCEDIDTVGISLTTSVKVQFGPKGPGGDTGRGRGEGHVPPGYTDKPGAHKRAGDLGHEGGAGDDEHVVGKLALNEVDAQPLTSRGDNLGGSKPSTTG
jgi:hypothetical protein